MKKIFTLLATLIFTFCITISAFATEIQAEQKTIRDGKVTLADNLKTYYQKLNEYSIIEFPFLKPNTTILVSNDCKTELNQPVKHATIYFYKEKVALLNYEFKNPASQEALVKEIDKKYNSPIVKKTNKKEHTGNYTREVYEWETPVGGIVLTHRTHPIIGESLTLSYIVKGVIDDPTYINGEMPQIPDM